MAIYRIKRFSSPDQPGYSQNDEENVMTSKDYQIENMKLQREILRNQRQEQRLREEERRTKLKAQMAMQRQENKENQEADKNQVRVKESQDRKDDNTRVGLYKKSTNPIKPVSMK